MGTGKVWSLIFLLTLCSCVTHREPVASEPWPPEHVEQPVYAMPPPIEEQPTPPLSEEPVTHPTPNWRNTYTKVVTPTPVPAKSTSHRPPPLIAIPHDPIPVRFNYVISTDAIEGREMNFQVQVHKGQIVFDRWLWAEKTNIVEHVQGGELLYLKRFVSVQLRSEGDFKVVALDAFPVRDLVLKELSMWSYIVTPLHSGTCKLWVEVSSSEFDPPPDVWELVKVYPVEVATNKNSAERATAFIERWTGVVKALSGFGKALLGLLTIGAALLTWLGIKKIKARRKRITK